MSDQRSTVHARSQFIGERANRYEMQQHTLSWAFALTGCLATVGCAGARVATPQAAPRYYGLHVTFAASTFAASTFAASARRGVAPSPVALPVGQKFAVRADCSAPKSPCARDCDAQN